MNQPDPAAAAWIDGDPLMEAIAAAVWEHCQTEGTSLVVDDPRNIAAVAAAAVPAAQPPADRAAQLGAAEDETRPDLNVRPLPAEALVADEVFADRAAHRDRIAEARDRLRGMALDLATGGGLVEPSAFRAALDEFEAEARAVLPEAAGRAAEGSGRAAEAELYVLLRKAGEDRYEAQALIDRHRDEVLRRLAGEQPAQNEARPRCPHCQLPHDLTPSMQLTCASIRASIADRDAPTCA